jgi:hypothetical protein
MDHMWERIGSQLIARVSGPMKFRLVLQPCMAAFFAIRAGLADVKAGKPPWFWELVSNPPQRADMVKEAWKRIGKVFILAVVLDVVYQLIVLHFVYPGEALIDTSDVGAPRRITRHITLVVVDHIYVPESLANRMP